ncbi:MAG TPA: hypothetical protein VKV73_32575 [Chloroflexota bacterium]|nr:hypothetical protein [Chloroflexota bacterium]
MRQRECVLGVLVTMLLLASVACAAAVPPASPGSYTPAGPAAAALAASPALPQADDLTFGQAAGRVLIGLTVRPAQPGPNTVLVYVMPPEGPAAAAEVPLTLAVGGQNVPLDTCSRTCRTANVTLTGGEHVDVVAGGASGGTAAFDLPTLPAPDGTALLEHVQERMHQLRTYRVDERLGPATPLLRAAYLFEAPDRMQLSAANGETTVWVGPTRYTRQVDSGTWRAEDFGSSLPVPSFVWDIPESGGTYVGAHVVGAETVDGVQTGVLSFFLGLPQTPVWFRLWSEPSGLVRRASMRAQGHFMDHRYTDFDAAVSIEPPN